MQRHIYFSPKVMLARLKMMADIRINFQKFIPVWFSIFGKSKALLYHTMKTYEIVKVYFHAFLTSALCVTTFMSHRLLFLKKRVRDSQNKRPARTQSLSGCFGEETNLLSTPGIKLQFLVRRNNTVTRLT